MKWTPERDIELRVLYASHTAAEVAEIMGISCSSVTNRAHKLQLKKFVHVGQYSKGSIPYNRGKRMKPEVYQKVRKHMFKKGHLPHNTKHDGCIVLRRKTKSEERYYFIRVALGKWRLYHHVVWENANGPIPEGMILAFKDRNTLNCTIDNLELITRAENMRRNSIINKSKKEREAIYKKASATKMKRYQALEAVLTEIEERRKQTYQFS